MADCKESNEVPKEPEPPVAMKSDSAEDWSDNSTNDFLEKLAAGKDSDSSSSNSTSNNESPKDQQKADSRFKESYDVPKEPEPPVAMKFDSAEDSSDNSANDFLEKLAAGKDSDSSSSNGTANNESPKDQQKTDSRFKVLTASKLGNCFGIKPSEFSSSSSKPKASLLRPSQLNAVTNSAGPTTKSLLQPSKFTNPFAKAANESEESESATKEKKDVEKSEESEKDDKDKKEDDENKEEKKEEKEKEKEAPMFLALSKKTKENENSLNCAVHSAASVSTPSFVFGQNLKERVAVAHDADSSDGSEKEDAKEEPANENGSSELMFSNVAPASQSSSKPGLTLSQAAQELEEANRANKRKYSEVALLTGEEDETNVLQINCKLFAFDKSTSSYQERGRGSLRLNDRDDESRLVGRAAGTQRLVLNTKVWPGMTAERAGPKSLRITAMDVQGDVRIFVVQAAQKEVEQLHNLLLQRLRRAKNRQSKKLAVEH